MEETLNNTIEEIPYTFLAIVTETYETYHLNRTDMEYIIFFYKAWYTSFFYMNKDNPQLQNILKKKTKERNKLYQYYITKSINDSKNISKIKSKINKCLDEDNKDIIQFLTLAKKELKKEKLNKYDFIDYTPKPYAIAIARND